MARILAVDTTADFGSLALADNGLVLEELPLHSTDGFSHVLWQHLDPLLRRHCWRLPDIDCFAAAAGPGSFTGVRVGLTAMKALADVEGKPMVGVSNLRAIASYGTTHLRAAILDARRGEVYAAVYSAAGNLHGQETVCTLQAFLANLPEGVSEIVTQSPDVFHAALPGRILTPAPRPLAGAIARIAETLAWSDPLSVDANYVRRSDAELFWKE